jgi:hypothetical protein
MALTYQEFLSNLTNQGLSGQNFTDYASQYNIPVTYNPELNRLLVNGVPVNISNSGLVNQNGQLFGTEQQYMNLINPAYQSQYGPQQEEALNEIQGMQPYQSPEFVQQFIEQMTQRQQQPFQFDPATDPSVQAAKGQLEQSIANMAAKRGFLYGSAQQDITAQQFQKLAPMFEEVAYKKEQDFLNRQLNLAGVIMQWDQMQADRRVDDIKLWQMKADFIMKLDQREFEQFRVMLDQRRAQMEFELERQKFEMETKKKQLELAYKKLDALGYADNEVSKILGIKPGTQAQWAKEMALKQKYELQQMEQKYKYDVEILKKNAAIEKELTKQKSDLDLNSALKLMKQEYGYDVKLMEKQFVHDEKIRKIKEAQAAAEQAAREAEAEAERAAREAENKAAAEQKAKDDMDQAVRETNLTNEYNYALKVFKLRLENGIEGGLVKKGYQQNAAYVLIELRKEGISEAVINRIAAEYRIPAYDGPIGPPAPKRGG